jgi:succinate dehydrogenase/fumarate reductase cytochrome b subunit
MSSVFKVLAFIVMLSVVAVLFAGLRNMMKGGSGNTSNKMMQMRVLLQAVALVLIVLAVYFGRPN